MASLQLDIVTPDCMVLSTEVDYVGAPGLLGEFGVLPGHIPFLSALAIGTLYYKSENETHFIFVSGGFAEVSDNKVTVLAESAEPATGIDFDRAERARERAEKRLAAKAEDISMVRSQASLQRAIHRLALRGKP